MWCFCREITDLEKCWADRGFLLEKSVFRTNPVEHVRFSRTRPPVHPLRPSATTAEVAPITRIRSKIAYSPPRRPSEESQDAVVLGCETHLRLSDVESEQTALSDGMCTERHAVLTCFFFFHSRRLSNSLSILDKAKMIPKLFYLSDSFAIALSREMPVIYTVIVQHDHYVAQTIFVSLTV